MTSCRTKSSLRKATKCVKKYLKTARTNKAKEIIEMGRESCAIEITPGYMASWKF